MIDAQRLLDYCRGQEDWLLDTIEALVALESPTDDKAAVDRCGDELSRRLTALGGTCHRVVAATAGNHLRAEFGSRPAPDPAARPLRHGLAGRPAPARCRWRATATTFDGPGVLRHEGGHRAGHAGDPSAPRARRRRDDCRIVMLWTTDEETGSATSRALLETEARQSDAVLVLEPALPGGVLKTQPQGLRRVRDRRARRGRARRRRSGQRRQRHSRAGAPGPGDRDAAGPRRAASRSTSASSSGGTRPNVVAAEARARVDVRAPTLADAEQIDAAFAALTPHLPGATSRSPRRLRAPADGANRRRGAALFDVAQAAGADWVRRSTKARPAEGRTETSAPRSAIPTLDGLGALGDGAHALHEHVLVSALVPRAALIALIARLADA